MSFPEVLLQHAHATISIWPVSPATISPITALAGTLVRTTADAYLDCGRCEGGFCPLKCDACGTERLLAFSCRRRGLCPSCAARTAALAAQHLVEAVLLPVPHRQVVLTIPKRLRIYFRFDRLLLADLARAAARAITDVVRVVTDRPESTPGIILALQTFNQDLTLNPQAEYLALPTP